MPTGLGDEKLWISATNDNTGTSTAFNDQSGNGNNGTASGTLVVADTSEGGTYAFEFDGVDDYIDTGSTAVHSNTVFSYSLWLKIPSSGVSEGVMGSYEFVTSDRGPLLVTDDTSLHALFYYQSNGSPFNPAESLESSLNVFDNTWRHVVCVFNGDNNTVKIYRDGVLLDEAVTNVPNSVSISTSFKIGTGASQYVGGLIDDARVYNREITQAEVVHLASSRGVEGPPLVGLGDEKLWLCPSLNDSANDISGNANSGTYEGGIGTISDAGSGGSRAYNMSTTSTSRIALPSSFDSVVFSDSTVTGWFKYTGVLFNLDASMALIGAKSSAAQWYSALRVNNSGATTGTYRTYADDGSNNGDSNVAGTGNEEDGSWHHVAFVRDYTTSTGTIYIDGVSIGSAAFTSSAMTATQDLYVGYSSLGAYGYSGNITGSGESLYYDDIRAYDRVLTQAEVFHLSTSRGVQGTPDIPAGLGTETGWWMPTYSEDNPNTPNIASSTLTQYNIVPTNIDSSDFVVDTDNGGEWAALSTYSTSTGHENRVVTGIKSQVFDTGGWTMTGWVKTVSPTNTQHLYDTDGGWVFRMQNGVFRLLGGINFTTTTTVPNNQWFHFAMSVDSNRTNYKFYMDGVLEETHTDSAFPTTGTDAIYISAQQSGNYGINGRWDDFRLFDTQISDADVATLASSRGAGGSAPPPSVFYNPFKSHAFKQLFQTRLR